jgi:hypothetical protein
LAGLNNFGPSCWLGKKKLLLGGGFMAASCSQVFIFGAMTRARRNT